jgi:hypothetical protein
MANLNGLLNGITTGMTVHAQDEAGTGGYNYYGYLSGDGRIVIMRVNTAETEYRYYLSTETNSDDTVTLRTFESEWATRTSKTYNKITQL